MYAETCAVDERTYAKQPLYTCQGRRVRNYHFKDQQQIWKMMCFNHLIICASEYV